MEHAQLKQSLKSASRVSFGATDTAADDKPKAVHRSFYADSPLKKKFKTEPPQGTGTEGERVEIAPSQLDQDGNEDENMPQKEGGNSATF